MKRANHRYLQNMGAHGRREGLGLDHIDFSRSHRNLYGLTPKAAHLGFSPKYPELIVDAYLQEYGIKVRKNSSEAMHLIVSVSPGYFLYHSLSEAENRAYETEQAKQILVKLLEWSKSPQFPGDLLCWRVDLDETTAHIDLFVVPTYTKKTKSGEEKWVSINKSLGYGGWKPALSKLQTDLANVLSPLGIVRGDPKSLTGAVHVHPRFYCKRKKKRDQEAKQTTQTKKRSEEVLPSKNYLVDSVSVAVYAQELDHLAQGQKYQKAAEYCENLQPTEPEKVATEEQTEVIRPLVP